MRPREPNTPQPSHGSLTSQPDAIVGLVEEASADVMLEGKLADGSTIGPTAMEVTAPNGRARAMLKDWQL